MNRKKIAVLAATLALAATGLGSQLSASAMEAATSSPSAASLSNIGHVFVIMLENKSYEESFGSQANTDSADSYLQRTLPSMGALLKEYYGTSHYSHSNYATLISGQPPNAYNQTDCPNYLDFQTKEIDSDGIAHGYGCVFPKQVKNIGNQLGSVGKSWKAYAESMDQYDGPDYTKGPGCRRPNLNGWDPTYSDSYNYVARHVPFLYFHSVIDSPDSCADHVVDYGHFAKDLANINTTPNLSFIVPNTCSDGHQAKCVDGSVGGITGINRYLKQAVPAITESPAFKKDGLLLVIYDEAEFDGTDAASSACCDAPLGPNSPSLGGIMPGAGGGRTGGIAISPFIDPGTVSTVPYNHYSTLRTIEDIFGLGHLGYAAKDSVQPFGSDVLTGK